MRSDILEVVQPCQLSWVRHFPCFSHAQVRAEHVKLSWMPPMDDGGTPITNYLVRYMDIDTGEWVSACTVSQL